MQETALIAQEKNKKGRMLDGESKVGSSKVKWKSGVQCFGYHKFGHIKILLKLIETHENTIEYAYDGNVFTIFKGMDTSSRDGWLLDFSCT